MPYDPEDRARMRVERKRAEQEAAQREAERKTQDEIQTLDSDGISKLLDDALNRLIDRQGSLKLDDKAVMGILDIFDQMSKAVSFDTAYHVLLQKVGQRARNNAGASNSGPLTTTHDTERMALFAQREATANMTNALSYHLMKQRAETQANTDKIAEHIASGTSDVVQGW